MCVWNSCPVAACSCKEWGTLMFFCDYQGGVLVIVAPSDSGGMLRMYANTLQSEYHQHMFALIHHHIILVEIAHAVYIVA